jgi:murein L,D-transpeptidase YcbB/YkuD
MIRLSFALALGGALLAAQADHADRQAAVERQLEGLVAAGRHPNLRWPDFTDVQADLNRIYSGRGWQLLWFVDDTLSTAGRALVKVLGEAENRGLSAADYDVGWLQAEAARPIPSGDSTRIARLDLGLSVAATRFALALRRGRINPAVVHATFKLPMDSFTVDSTILRLASSSRPNDVLTALEPNLLHYYLLIGALVRYRELARDSALVSLPRMPRRLRPGESYVGLSSLRRLLRLLGDDRDSISPPIVDTLYSGAVVEAVKRFQARQGFTPDGVIGDSTRARMQRPFAQPIRQLELTLERFRWMPRRYSAPPIIVNIPAFRLYAFSGEQSDESSLLRMNVVVGTAFKTETPVFAADMTYLVFSPSWDVTPTIALNEVKPAASKKPEWLDRNQMELIRGQKVVPSTPENIAAIGNGVRVRQKPGPHNALGGVKFLLPNDYQVYLHDTPSRSLFGRSRRDASHGCIRLEDPFALARFVLRDQPEWTDERIRTAMKRDTSERVNLTHPIPVFIVYGTAIARENGDVYFYSDVYGHDRALDRVLKKGYPYRR